MVAIMKSIYSNISGVFIRSRTFLINNCFCTICGSCTGVSV